MTEIETAGSGAEALRLLHTREFGLVTLDIEMPGMDGFAVLRWIMARHPMPVLVVSEAQQERVAIVALEMGAFDVLRKPSFRQGGLASWKLLLARAVEGASELQVLPLARRARAGESGLRPAGPLPSRAPWSGGATRASALIVAASTGGPPAIRDLFATLRPRPVAVAVAQHMPAPFTRSLAARLDSTTGWRAREAVDGEEVTPGTVLVAPGGHDLEFVKEGGRVLCRVQRVLLGAHHPAWSPSADRLLLSAARVWGAGAVAVVLTGMGDDGAEGAGAIADAGGTVIAESRETAVVAGMPEAAARRVPSAIRLPLNEIPRELEERFPLATLPGPV